MDQGLIPRRYAKALLSLASDHATDAGLYAAMLNLAASFDAEPDLAKAIANPHIPAADKTALILEAARPADRPVADELENFMRLLEQNRRTDMLRNSALAYIDLYRSAHRIYSVTVSSPAPLEPAELERITTLVRKHLPEGSTMELTRTTDPRLIGGFTIAIDNELLDASVASELKQLRLKLLSH